MATKQELLAQLRATVTPDQQAPAAPVQGDIPFAPGSKQDLLERLRQTVAPTAQKVSTEGGTFGRIPEIAQSIASRILAGVETGATIATGAIAEPVAGLAGIAGTLLPGETGQGARFVEATREALTFQPPTTAGQTGLQAVGEALQPAGEILQAGETALGEAGFAVGQVAETITGVEGIAPVTATIASSLPTAALEIIGFKGANIAKGQKRLTGITDDVEQSLAVEGISVDDLSPENVRNIQSAIDRDVNSQANRADFLRSQGIQPTQAQISRDAADFQQQQELAKSTSKVREALEGQEALLVNRFDESIAGTGGQALTSGSPVTDAVINRSTTLDNEISDLYRQARDIAPGEKNVRMNELSRVLRERAPSNEAANGLIRSIRGNLEARGILDNTFKVRGRVDVDTAEEVRKFINTHFDSTSDLGRGFMREFKDALDTDVLKAANEDIFSQARKAKATFERDLNRAKINKFDKRKGSLVREILENKFDPDKIAAKIAESGTVRAQDVQQLKTYLTQTGTPEQRATGLNAWNDLRAETLNTIKERAFTGPEDAAGNKALSRAAFETALNRVGREKRSVLFTPAENRFLNDMLRTSKLREPVRGTALGKGPTAQAIGSLQRQLDRIPILGTLVSEITTGVQGGAVIRGKPRKPLSVQVQEGKSPGIATAGVLTGIIEQSRTQEQPTQQVSP